MRGYSHLIVAGATGFSISTMLEVSPVTGMVVGAAGGIICDIDEEHSLINTLLMRKVPYGLRSLLKILIGAIGIFGTVMINKHLIAIQRNIMVGIIYMMAIFIISGVSAAINQRNHRGIFHDPLLGSLIMLTPLLVIFDSTLVIIFGAGLFTHYLTDPINDSGIPFYLGGKNCRLRYPIRISYDNQLAELIFVGVCISLILLVRHVNI